MNIFIGSYYDLLFLLFLLSSLLLNFKIWLPYRLRENKIKSFFFFNTSILQERTQNVVKEVFKFQSTAQVYKQQKY